MEETARQVAAYLQASPILNLAIALIAGLAASKTVAYERRRGWLFSFAIGLLGFFLAEFAIFYSGLVAYFDQLPAFRVIFDFIAAYIGSFAVAAVVHFIKPM